ncbi:MAG TPA: hypothetical protein VNY06_00150 [Methylocella sp.]|nr:hypothetical protein [Methylocella sp.]
MKNGSIAIMAVGYRLGHVFLERAADIEACVSRMAVSQSCSSAQAFQSVKSTKPPRV